MLPPFAVIAFWGSVLYLPKKKSNYRERYNFFYTKLRISRSVNNITDSTKILITFLRGMLLFVGSCSSHIHLRSFYQYYYFSSPGSPSCYPNNQDCVWLFEAPSHHVFLYVYNFNVEYGGGSCPYDYLEIRDGNSPSSPLINKTCGSLYYMYIYTSSRFLFLRFHSNGYTQMPGFDAYCYATTYSK